MANDRNGALHRGLRLARLWYASEESALAWGLTAAVLLLTLGQIGIALRVSVWHRQFFDALAARDSAGLVSAAWVFAALALGTMTLAVAQLWAKQMLALRWRRWLVCHLQEGWLAGARHYRMGLLDESADNPDQRISESTRWATAMAVDLTVGLLHAVLMGAGFIGILWAASGWYVIAVLAYAAAGAALTWLLGRPLIRLHVARNKAEADHRSALIRLREQAEAVALMDGGRDEGRGLRLAFGEVVGAMNAVLRRERHLMWIGSGYGMVAGVLALLLGSPAYLAGALTLGALVQLGQAFQQVAMALAWFQESWPRLADWCSHLDRLAVLEQSYAEADALATGAGPVVADGATIALERLQIALPTGRTLLDATTLAIAPGERVLIQGESGSGKSTLFRALAGLWPWGEGQVRMPPRADCMLLPQRPYLPLGTLGGALCYPAAPDAFPAAAQRDALIRCGLGAHAARLAERAPWDRMLSLGEQQRLAFARLLLHRPAWALLDEATSALDAATEARVMSLFGRELAETTLVSIGHRATLAQWHTRVLRLEEGRLVEAAAPPPLPPPGRSRVAHAHAVPDPRPARTAERARAAR